MNYFLSIRSAVKNNWENDTETINKNNYNIEFPYLELKDDDDAKCDKGLQILDILKHWQKYGIPKAQDIEDNHFDCQPQFSPSTVIASLKNTIQNFEKISSLNEGITAKQNNIKYELIENNPVIAVLYTPPSFKHLNKGLWSPKEPPSRVNDAHAITIIGYDDNYKGGAFEIVNSWGENWGKNGFAWIPYEVFIDWTPMIFKISDYNRWGHIDLDLTAIENPATLDFNELTKEYELSYPKKVIPKPHVKLYDQSRGHTYIFNLHNKKLDLFYPLTTNEVRKRIQLSFERDKHDDYIIILYSPEKEKLDISKLSSISANPDKTNTVRKLLNELLNDKLDKQLIPETDINYTIANDQIYFDGFSNLDNAIVPIIIKIVYDKKSKK